MTHFLFEHIDLIVIATLEMGKRFVRLWLEAESCVMKFPEIRSTRANIFSLVSEPWGQPEIPMRVTMWVIDVRLFFRGGQWVRGSMRDLAYQYLYEVMKFKTLHISDLHCPGQSLLWTLFGQHLFPVPNKLVRFSYPFHLVHSWCITIIYRTHLG